MSDITPVGRRKGPLLLLLRVEGIPSSPVVSTDTVGGPHSWTVEMKVPALHVASLAGVLGHFITALHGGRLGPTLGLGCSK